MFGDFKRGYLIVDRMGVRVMRDAAQAKLAGARATTCDEAMPYVNQLLDSVR